MNNMNTSEKVNTCLDYLDQRLEATSEQTIQIAEVIIEDIKILTQGYHDAMKDHNLLEHAKLVRDTQRKWVNQLHDIIIEQTNRDLNGQVIQALQKFATGLNQPNPPEFTLPSIVARTQNNEFEYLNQDEIDSLMMADNFNHASSSHH